MDQGARDENERVWRQQVVRLLERIDKRLEAIEQAGKSPKPLEFSNISGSSPPPKEAGTYINGEKWVLCQRCGSHHPERQWCICSM